MSAATASFTDALDDLQARSLREILSASRLLSLATVSPEGEAHINTAFFAFSDAFVAYVLSPTPSEHAGNAAMNTSAALAVFDSHQTRQRRRGAQLFGRLEEVDPGDGDAALACFRSRFPDVAGEDETYADVILGHGSALYAFHPSRAKLFERHSSRRMRTSRSRPSSAGEGTHDSRARAGHTPTTAATGPRPPSPPSPRSWAERGRQVARGCLDLRHIVLPQARDTRFASSRGARRNAGQFAHPLPKEGQPRSRRGSVLGERVRPCLHGTRLEANRLPHPARSAVCLNSRRIPEPAAGLEPATPALQERCATNCARPAWDGHARLDCQY